MQPNRFWPAGASVLKYCSPTVQIEGFAALAPVFAGKLWALPLKSTVPLTPTIPPPLTDIRFPVALSIFQRFTRLFHVDPGAAPGTVPNQAAAIPRSPSPDRLPISQVWPATFVPLARSNWTPKLRAV